MQVLSATMERVHAVTKYSKYYKKYKASLPDKTFFEEYKAQITLYENVLSELKKSYPKLPNSRDILSELDNLQKKEYPHVRVFFLKIYYGRALQDTKKLQYS